MLSFESNSETMKMINENKSKCEFLSHVISVDTKENNYDLLMSFSTIKVNKTKIKFIII
jgi:hypothetical protein